MNYSPEYKQLQERLHTERPDYGVSGQRYSDQVMQLSQKLGTRDILDYGCGKQTLQKNLPFPIHNYDPFIPGLDKEPVPADIVVCTDVMEHIEPAHFHDVLQDLHRLTKKVIFLQIDTGPAKKFLADGRNAHLIQQPPNWWINHLMSYFNMQQMQNLGHGFVSIWTPITQEDEA